jgi:hypothetical protein
MAESMPFLKNTLTIQREMRVQSDSAIMEAGTQVQGEALTLLRLCPMHQLARMSCVWVTKIHGIDRTSIKERERQKRV